MSDPCWNRHRCAVWDPHNQKDIDKLEAVQRRAAHFVLNRHHTTSSVSSTLDSLGWPSLKQRRKSARLGTLYKINHGLVHCPIIKNKLVPAPSRERRVHCQQFKRINTITQYRDSSFLPQTVRARGWNALPEDASGAPTVGILLSQAIP